MKNKVKKFIYYISIILCFICLISSIFLQTTYYHFDPINVKNNIKLITSDEYEGRLTGSEGNYKISSTIEDSFKKSKLTPFNDTYRESFEITTPVKNNTIPQLTIKNDSTILHNYKYGVDFKEDMINFRTPNVTFTNKDRIDIFESSFIIQNDNKNYLFYVSFDKDFKFRSSFNSKSKYEFSVAITTDVYNSMLDSLRNGNKVTINLPYTLKSSETSNIIGILKGTSDTLPPLVISAHFDHLGIDALGNHYNGALDNASGTAFMLELSKSLSSFVKPNRDIIFVALTGEEFGLLGSKIFAKEYLDTIKGGKIINFDMIGAANTPISLMTGSILKDKEDESTSELLDSFKNICSNKGLNYTVKFEDSSDHASFTNLGIDSVTLCHSDLSKIHTPQDTVDYIDIDAIANVYSVVQEEIYEYAYNDFILLFYNNKVAVFFLIVTILLVVFPTIKNKFKNQIIIIFKSNFPLISLHKK